MASPAPPLAAPALEQASAALARRHLRLAWWSLLVFLSLGIVLETLHGFKVAWYVNEAHATRRLLWTLAHAHGVLLALVNVAYAGTLRWLGAAAGSGRRASWCLVGATLLVPGGFLLGGVGVHGGDPGYGIVLLPIGAALLFVGVLLVARALHE
ncbi:MAG: hypothetical protein AB1689_03635 [Thermodesulfobacteriota bacterium]